MSFDKLSLIKPILTALEEEGYTIPTPIQKESIPIILAGRDLLGCAQTGTGKTAAFAIPILQLLSRSAQLPLPRGEGQGEGKKYTRKIHSLVVTPTRELAMQIKESFEAYGRHTGLKTTVIFGGVGQAAQVNALSHGVDILIATPGRLLDLINQKHVSLSDIEIFVLDEADRMLDMGFIHDVKRLIAILPKKRQSLFFSATMAPEIVKLAHTILYNPEKVTVTPVSSTVEIINQSVYHVDKANKNHLLLHLLEDESIKTVLVFTRTKHGANKVVKLLLEKGITADAIHGNKAQNARQRALNNFKNQTLRVLVATDIAARGIDVDNLEYVINFEVPNVSETYVHRIGRTGRAGAAGTAISFSDAEEKTYIADIEKLIAKKIPIVEDHPWPLMIHNAPKRTGPEGRGNFSHPWPKKGEEEKKAKKPSANRPQGVQKPPRPKPTWGTESANLSEDLHRRETPRFPKVSPHRAPKKILKTDENNEIVIESKPVQKERLPKKSWKKDDDKSRFPASKPSRDGAPKKAWRRDDDKKKKYTPKPERDGAFKKTWQGEKDNNKK